MASGFGFNGGRPRCFAFWQEFSKCYAGAESTEQCIAPKEDYLECLHRTKEVARAKEIKTHFLQSASREGADARKLAEKEATGVIVNLGIVNESA